MATWKKVQLGDPVNLATSDLTIEGDGSVTQERTFTLPPATASSSLQFRAPYGSPSTIKTFLRIESDSDDLPSIEGQNYVYTPALQVGNFDLTGTTSRKGYNLPSFSSSVGLGKIIATTNSWSTYVGETDFVSFDDWLDPGFSTGHGFASASNYSAGPPSDDKLIVYDDSASAYKPATLNEVSNAQGYVFTFSADNATTYYTNGSGISTVYLGSGNGANFGSPGDPSNAYGHLVLEDNTFIMGVSWRSYVTNYYASNILGKIMIDGSTSWQQVYNGVTYSSSSYQFLAGATSASTNSGQEVTKTAVYASPIPVNAGQAVTMAFEYEADSNATTENHIATIYLKTFNSQFATPTIV